MTAAIAAAVGAQCAHILAQLRKEGVPGVMTARYGLENLGLTFDTVWALIRDTLGETAYARYLE